MLTGRKYERKNRGKISLCDVQKFWASFLKILYIFIYLGNNIIGEVDKMKIEEIEKNLSKIKDVVIYQQGFIESKFEILNIKYDIKEDILNINNNDNYFKININQIYDVKDERGSIILFLDNDTQIKIASKN